MRITKLALLAAAAVAACSDNSGNGPTDAPNNAIVDAPEFAPSITGLIANPNVINTPGVPTPVTFTWSYLVEPTFPDPTCTMDAGIGPVMRGVPVMVTISQLTLITLTCTNRAGQATRQVLINVPPVAPALATFTASPTAISPNTPTNVTFTWTYSNTPNPPPTCSLDNGTTTITSGTQVSETLTQARSFRLRCTNSQGTVYSGPPSAVADVTVQVNECGTAYASCDAHATCAESPTNNAYTCACNTGYTGSGDSCNFSVTDCVTTPSQCDTNATCVGGVTCACKAGYLGSGAPNDCQRVRGSFVTATSGPPVFSAAPWNAAGAGIAAADAYCATQAAAKGLAGASNYIAWMSDSTSDAFCRVQGLTGKRSGGCGLGAGNTTYAAGPWVRSDGQGALPNLQTLTGANPATYYPISTNENGVEITPTLGANGVIADRVWTGTDASGQYVTNATCSDWTNATLSFSGAAGEVFGGGTSWTQTSASSPLCNAHSASTPYHLRCVEKNAGAALPPRHTQNMKKVFLTSVSGNGNFLTWPDNYGQTLGQNAADAICQARARFAGYPNASLFKAWLTTYGYGTSPYYMTNRITNVSSGYARPDGVVLGTSRADMLDGRFGAAWEETELNTYPAGSLDAGSVVTNIYSSTTTGQYYQSSSFYMCNYWTTNSSGYDAYYGRWDLLDTRATNTFNILTCDQTVRLLCAEDQ